MKTFRYKVGKTEFVFIGNGYRDAVRRNKSLVKKWFKRNPDLPMLVNIDKISYWDIREFLKEAGIKIIRVTKLIENESGKLRFGEAGSKNKSARNKHFPNSYNFSETLKNNLNKTMQK
jgi:hypothetical protein